MPLTRTTGRSHVLTSVLKKLLLSFMGLALSIALVEASVRLLGLADHRLTDPAFAVDPAPEVGYRYKSHFRGRVQGPTRLETNAFGARDREFARVKAAGTLRIVVMGDSFAFGQGVEQAEAFPKVLERDLEARVRDRPVEVINFGVQAYSIRQEVARYLTEAIHFQPDIAVLTMIAHDLDPRRERNHVDADGYLTKSIGGEGRWKVVLRHSHLAYLGKDLAYGIVGWLLEAKTDQLSDETLEQRLDVFEHEVSKFVETSERAGIVPVFAMVDVAPSTWSDAILVRLRQRHPRLAVADCSPSFRRIDLARLVLPRDGHPTPETHRIIANHLLTTLVDILPGR